jgi:hypothetical protein
VRRLVREMEQRESLLDANLSRPTALEAELRALSRRRDQTIVATAVLVLGVMWIGLGAEPWWAGGAAAVAAIAFLLVRS